MHGDIVYIELALKEIEETLVFYKKLFQWSIVESHFSRQAYYMFKTRGNRLSGAFDANVLPSVEGVQMYLQCDDIEETLERIERDFPRAKVLKPKTFLSKEYGWYALIVDPSGNRIGLQEDYPSQV